MYFWGKQDRKEEQFEVMSIFIFEENKYFKIALERREVLPHNVQGN